MVKVSLTMLAPDKLDFTSYLEVLDKFCREPSKEFYLEELSNSPDIKLAKPTIARALAELRSRGLVTDRLVGRAVLYRADLENPIVRQFHVLLIVGNLYSVFKDFSGSEVYLFGSHSRGDEREYSDIDLLFVGNAPRDQVRKACDKVEESIGKRVSPVVYSKQEFSMLAQNEKNRAFFENLIRNSIKVNRWT